MKSYVHYEYDDSIRPIDLPDYNNFKVNTVLLRNTFVIGILLMFSRINYFLGLVDGIAPLLSIVYQIFYDIGYFMFVLIFSGFAFAISFYILGRNQLNFDNIDEYSLTLYPIKY